MEEEAQEGEENSSKKRKADELENSEEKPPKKQKIEETPVEKYVNDPFPYKAVLKLIFLPLGKEIKTSLHV